MSRLDELLGDNYEVRRFSDLPRPHQFAIAYYMAVDSDAWAGLRTDDFLSAAPQPIDADWRHALKAALPRFIAEYGDCHFGLATLPVEAVKRAVMGDVELKRDFPDWPAYHQWYCSSGPVPSHPASNRWPVVLSSHDDETLQDGWHRLHSYVRGTHTDIPAVFFPEMRHLRAKRSGS